MILETERLTLRAWSEADAKELFSLAKNPVIGKLAGWKPHENAAESLQIIRGVLSEEGCFAICLKERGELVGSIGLGRAAWLAGEGDELELGFWIGEDFWGKGYATEVVSRMLKYGFEERECNAIWARYFVGNEKSRRVLDKCGFVDVREEEGLRYMKLLRDNYLSSGK